MPPKPLIIDFLVKHLTKDELGHLLLAETPQNHPALKNIKGYVQENWGCIAVDDVKCHVNGVLRILLPPEPIESMSPTLEHDTIRERVTRYGSNIVENCVEAEGTKMHAIMTLRVIGVMLAIEDDPYRNRRQFIEAMVDVIGMLTGLEKA